MLPSQGFLFPSAPKMSFSSSTLSVLADVYADDLFSSFKSQFKHYVLKETILATL